MFFIRKKRLNLLVLTFLAILSISIYAATTGTVYIRNPSGGNVAQNDCNGDNFQCQVSSTSCNQVGWYYTVFAADTSGTQDCRPATSCGPSNVQTIISNAYCCSKITGIVQDQDGNPLNNAKIEAFKGSVKAAEAYSQADGSYEIFVPGCGIISLVASKADYISETQTIDLSTPKTLENTDFQLTYGIVCEADCSYLIDTRCHQECEGVKGCSFYDGTSMSNCDKSYIGWEVDYDSNRVVECCTGSPKEKTGQKADAACPSGNLVKSYRLLYRGGKPIRMVTVVCGD